MISTFKSTSSTVSKQAKQFAFSLLTTKQMKNYKMDDLYNTIKSRITKSRHAISYQMSASGYLIKSKYRQKCVIQTDITCDKMIEILPILSILDIFEALYHLKTLFLQFSPSSQGVKLQGSVFSNPCNMGKRSFHPKCPYFPQKMSASIACTLAG